MHTEHTRLHVGAFFLTHWTKSRSRVTSSSKKAPGTINVSICVLLKVRTESVTSATPLAVFTAHRDDRVLVSRETSAWAWATESGSYAERLQRSCKVEQ